VKAYEARLAELDLESTKQAEWARSNEANLNAEMTKLAGHISKLDSEITRAGTQLAEYQKKLDEAEKLVIERTQWAQKEQGAREEAETKLNAVEASRWIRMGKAFRLGPKLS